MLKEENSELLDQYLTHYKNFSLEVRVGFNTILSINPFKCQYLVTETKDYITNIQIRCDTWSEACKEFNILLRNNMNEMSLK